MANFGGLRASSSRSFAATSSTTRRIVFASLPGFSWRSIRCASATGSFIAIRRRRYGWTAIRASTRASLAAPAAASGFFTSACAGCGGGTVCVTGTGTAAAAVSLLRLRHVVERNHDVARCGFGFVTGAASPAARRAASSHRLRQPGRTSRAPPRRYPPRVCTRARRCRPSRSYPSPRLQLALRGVIRVAAIAAGGHRVDLRRKRAADRGVRLLLAGTAAAFARRCFCELARPIRSRSCA